MANLAYTHSCSHKRMACDSLLAKQEVHISADSLIFGAGAGRVVARLAGRLILDLSVASGELYN